MKDQPTSSSQRIELLDVYRGFAIFGIFVVNIVIMHSTFLNQDEFNLQWTSIIDLITDKVLHLFFYTKFFPIFSLLFGLGISMQALKMWEQKKLSFSFFFRRMFILFLIGVCHVVFLWSGDVLNIYAILGLFVTFFIKRSNTFIIASALIVLLFPFYDQLLEFIFNLFGFQPEIYLNDQTGESINQIIKNGSYVEGAKLRLLEYLSNIPLLFGYLGPIALSMFLFGLYLGKNKIHHSLDSFIDRIKKPVIIITILTNFYRLLFLFVLTDLEIYKNAAARTTFIEFMVISDVVMGLFYLWLIGWMWYKWNWKKLLSPLRYVGRMALTNYIMQSFIGLILFSSIGFKLYETLSPSQTFGIAILVFLIQILISKIWLLYFKFGPLEWAWRCLTYKKLLSIK